MVSKDRKGKAKQKVIDTKAMADKDRMPLLFFLGSNPEPALYIPKGMLVNPTTVIISGSDPDLHQLRWTPRSKLRTNIEDTLKKSSEGNLLETITSFIFDLNKQEKYKTKRWFVGKPNKATQLYWALQDQLVPWNPKTKAGKGTGKVLRDERQLGPGSQKDAGPNTLFRRPASKPHTIPATFATRLPTKPYENVGTDADGVFQTMSSAELHALCSTKSFGHGGSHNAYDIPNTRLVIGVYRNKSKQASAVVQRRASVKVMRITKLQNITKSGFAHLPLHVDPLTGDYYAEKMDTDLFQASIHHWTPEEAAQALHSFLAGVRDLHKKGWVHRDIKPDNIYLQGTQLKLADWDTARTKNDLTTVAWDHATVAYSQFKITDPSSLTPDQAFKMAKCTDLLATIQTFYETYTFFGLFEKNGNKNLQAVQNILLEILQPKLKDHERNPLGYNLADRKGAPDHRYDPKDLDEIYQKLPGQIARLNIALKAVMPANIDQVSGQKSEKKLEEYGNVTQPVRADTFATKKTASMARSFTGNKSNSTLDDKDTKRESPHGQKGPR